VGLTFTCPNCELEFWTHLDDVATEIICEYCGKRFNVTPQLKDGAWAYRRSGLFGREDHQQGAIPVALTLQQLDSILHWEMVYVTSMTLESAGARIVPCETDLVIVSEKGFLRGHGRNSGR
jgi:DNA-directed RNA polymerase subunit RPC12/RpoP